MFSVSSVSSVVRAVWQSALRTVVIGCDRLYVNVGSSLNARQVQNRIAQSPGAFPAPDLPIRAGVLQRVGGRNTKGQTPTAC